MPKTNKPHSVPAPKAFDVFRPGRASVPSTSRPVIVGHKPQVQDSTLTDKPGSPVPNAYGERELSDPRKKVETVPPVNNEIAEQASQLTSVAEPAVSAAKQTEHAIQSPTEQTESESGAIFVSEGNNTSETSEQHGNETETNFKGSEEESIRALVQAPEMVSTSGAEQLPGTSADLLSETVDTDLHNATGPEPQTPIVDTSQIVVSHHHIKRHAGMKIFLAVLLILVVAAAVVDVLLDSGVVTLNHKIPHTHLIHQ